MDESKQKEEFNNAYICALAAHAGLNRGNLSVDDDSVDIMFQGRGYVDSTIRNPQIQIQLKCTSQNLVAGDVIKFPLSRKNYDDLRGENVISPRYLVVLLIPEDKGRWVQHNDDHIALFNLCYWLSLRNSEPTNNTASITVDVPLAQRLTTDALRQPWRVAMNESYRRVGNVSAQQLEAYLQNKRWMRDGKIRSIATVWHRLDSEDAEVVLPLSPTVKDYGQRLKDALSAVASYEQRPVVEVISDVVRFFANVITVRVIHADTKDGTIPINDGVLLISKAKELLFSAAMSIYVKKKQFTGAPPKDARAYIDSLLLGQTEIGSYVVNVIAPIHGDAAVQAQTVEELPLAEAVTLNLATGLEALKQASKAYEEHHDVKVFEVAVQQGASANMCDALLGFSGVERNRSFEIKITVSPGPMFTSKPRVFDFDATYIEALTKASDYYKDDYVLENCTLMGFVRKLSRPKGKNFGTVTIQAIAGDVERNVQIELSGDDYHNAVLAHDKQSFVRCSGNVHVKSKSARLMNPHDFRVIATDDLL